MYSQYNSQVLVVLDGGINLYCLSVNDKLYIMLSIILIAGKLSITNFSVKSGMKNVDINLPK